MRPRLTILVILLALACGCTSAASKPTPSFTPIDSSTDTAEVITPSPNPKVNALSGLTAKEKVFIRDARKKLPADDDATNTELIHLGRDFCGQGSSETAYDQYGGNPPNVEGIAQSKDMLGSVERSAVLHFCPKYIRTWKQAMGGFDHGDHEVGKDIKPGRYRTLDKGLKDCYWERVSKAGDTLANGLVTFAPGYITVTILPSDGGFSSTDKCYFWVPADV